MPQQPGGAPPSMLQGLQGVLGELGSLMAAPDADPQFLIQLQMAITGKIKQGTQQAIQGGMGPQRIGPGGGAGPSGFGGAAPAMAGAGGPGGPPGAGAGQPMGAPNPDELRRVMGATGQTQ